jgi:hypothetical protein
MQHTLIKYVCSQSQCCYTDVPRVTSSFFSFMWFSFRCFSCTKLNDYSRAALGYRTVHYAVGIVTPVRAQLYIITHRLVVGELVEHTSLQGQTPEDAGRKEIENTCDSSHNSKNALKALSSVESRFV